MLNVFLVGMTLGRFQVDLRAICSGLYSFTYLKFPGLSQTDQPGHSFPTFSQYKIFRMCKERGKMQYQNH